MLRLRQISFLYIFCMINIAKYNKLTLQQELKSHQIINIVNILTPNKITLMLNNK